MLGAAFVIPSSANAENAGPSIDLLPYTDHLVENCAKEPLSLEDVRALIQHSYKNFSKLIQKSSLLVIPLVNIGFIGSWKASRS
jgi:hypothetical protein